MDREQIESLHEKASGAYLQGDYVAALAAWDQLLGASPNDERAREGIRLCRMMVQSEDEPLDDGKDLDDALTAFNAPEDSAPEPDAENASTWPGREIAGETPADAPDLGPGLDPELLGEMGDEAPVADDAAPEGEPELEGLLADEDAAGADAEPVAPPADATADNPAAAELQKRIGELLDQARTAVSEGRNDDALGILARLFILDDGHAEAQALAEHVRSTMEGQAREIDARIEEGVQVLENGDLDEARQIFQSVLEVAPYHQEAKHYLEKIEARMDEAEGAGPDGEGSEADPLPMGEAGAGTPADTSQDHGAIDLEGGDESAVGVSGVSASGDDPFSKLLAAELEEIDDEDFRDEVEEEAAEEEEDPAAKPSRKKTETSPVLLAVAVIVMIGAGVYAWFFTDLLRKREPASEPMAAAAAAGINTGNPDGAASTAEDGTAGSAEERSTEELLAQAEQLTRNPDGSLGTTDPARVRKILDRARQHMDEEDYPAAVFAFNEALELDPGNEQAHQGMLDAGRLFREHKQQLEELDRAIDSFRAGDYEGALRTLYRLPQDLDPETVELAKLASWYNLGLTHLRAGETAEAIRYFDEALQIREDDSDAAEARELAERFSNLVHDRTYYAQVEQFDFRDL
jgi:tetratricopeptide (TPR) repeat protein